MIQSPFSLVTSTPPSSEERYCTRVLEVGCGEVIRTFASAALVLFASQCTESFGILDIEAVSVGWPMVAFNVEGSGSDWRMA